MGISARAGVQGGGIVEGSRDADRDPADVHLPTQQTHFGAEFAPVEPGSGPTSRQGHFGLYGRERMRLDSCTPLERSAHGNGGFDDLGGATREGAAASIR